MNSALLIDAPGVLCDGAGLPLSSAAARAWLHRVADSGVRLLVLRAPGDPRLAEWLGLEAVTWFTGAALPPVRSVGCHLLEAGCDVTRSWLIGADPQALGLAASVGCLGAVWVGDGTPPRLALHVVEARDVADAPRVMIPPGGGCWHDQRLVEP